MSEKLKKRENIAFIMSHQLGRVFTREVYYGYYLTTVW